MSKPDDSELRRKVIRQLLGQRLRGDGASSPRAAASMRPHMKGKANAGAA